MSTQFRFRGFVLTIASNGLGRGKRLEVSQELDPITVATGEDLHELAEAAHDWFAEMLRDFEEQS